MDPILTTLLKDILPSIIKLITNIINISLQFEVFAKTWKVAVIKWLFKKIALDLIPQNYHSVSNLAFPSEVLECCILNQFDQHCSKHGLMPEYQLAYRKDFSCETALVKIINDCLLNMENQQVTAIVAIDLSTAFDTVDHHILIDVLNKRFNIAGVALEWFSNYLSSRSCKVIVEDVHSTEKPLSFSVPQGSVAGPVLYNAYASTLREAVNPSIDLHGLPDDHIIKDSFKPISEEECRIIHTLEQCTSDIKDWMDANQLCMNSATTEFLLVGSRRQLSSCVSTEINVNGEAVKHSACIKYLGAWVDDKLNFKIHIANKCQIAMWNLHKLKAICDILTEETCKTLVMGLVISHLDYANAILVELPETDIHKLQQVQNIVAKLTLNKDKHDIVTDCFIKLHWLPIRTRIHFKILTLTYKCLNGQAPEYLCNLLTVNETNDRHLRSSSQYRRLIVPFVRLQTFTA